MPTLEIAEDDLVVIIPRDIADQASRARILVGERQVGLVQEFTCELSVDRPAVVTVRFPEIEGLRHAREVPSGHPVIARILANQALIGPWVDGGPRQGPTLWDRLDDENV